MVNGTPGYFFQGYPVEEVKQRYGRDAYKMQVYEIQSLKDIRNCMQKGLYDENQEMLEENIMYIQSLIKKLSMVAMTEQNEGIMNTELRSSIEEVKALYGQLMGKLQKGKTIER